MTFPDRRKEKGKTSVYRHEFLPDFHFTPCKFIQWSTNSGVWQTFFCSHSWLMFSTTDEIDATLLYTFGLAQLSSVAIRPPIEEEVVIDTEFLSKLTSFHRIASIVSERTLFLAIKYCDTKYDHKEYVEFWYFPDMSQMRTLIGIISKPSAIPMGSAQGFSCTGVVIFSSLITGNCIGRQFGRNLVTLPCQSHGNSSC